MFCGRADCLGKIVGFYVVWKRSDEIKNDPIGCTGRDQSVGQNSRAVMRRGCLDCDGPDLRPQGRHGIDARRGQTVGKLQRNRTLVHGQSRMGLRLL